MERSDAGIVFSLKSQYFFSAIPKDFSKSLTLWNIIKILLLVRMEFRLSVCNCTEFTELRRSLEHPFQEVLPVYC